MAGDFDEMRRLISDLLPHNTFIGGVGSVLTTPALLADRLGISSSNIENFQIDGSNNISCAITSNYSLPNGAFQNSSVYFPYNILTYFVDLEGKCTSMQFRRNFLFQSNLDFVFFPNLSDDGIHSDETFRGCSSLKIAYLYGDSGFIKLGPSAAANSIFWAVTYANLDVYIKDYFATNNSGNPDGDLTQFSLKSVNYLSSTAIPIPVQNKLNTIIP
ncbi:MAG TPA: hypothetical protein PKH16_09875 [Aequorivita sp.]|nr:hypothetical protein [Aequorivita sp.]